MRIAMVASESNPYIKTGGLADVIGALSEELASKGHDVRVFLPFYSAIAERLDPNLTRLGGYTVHLSWRQQDAFVAETEYRGVKFYFIGNDYYFFRGGGIYGFDDDGERFAFFSLAVRDAFRFLDWKPDIVHVHDWQPGMLPVLIKEQNAYDPFYNSIKFVLTIHNPEFKGMIDRYFLNNFYGLNDEIFDNGNVRFHGQVSTLKSAIVYCDKITTVSPTHREELLSPEGSRGLSGVLQYREKDFVGIVNGVDTIEWDPSDDPLLDRHYTASSFEEGKARCKAGFLNGYGIQGENRPMFGIVSRLTDQKGIQLVLEVASHIFERGGILAILGSGQYEYHMAFERLRSEHPDSCAIYIGYNNALAHKIYAASDFFLMPSLFEPCGIGQMIAERYGALPIVRATGGLADTVISVEEEGRNGVVFRDFDANALRWAVDKAFDAYQDKALLKEMIRNAMNADHSWCKSAESYLRLYEDCLER